MARDQTTYTTPNLQYPADNGNQYRAIVNVACDDSSATSSVATVTLTAPVNTSPGVIMNDTFPARHSFPRCWPRNQHPFSLVHFSYITLSAADLVTDPSGTGLIATPIAGSSSLYLGYFVNETPTSRLPVDLAIGTQITATLNFIPNSFSSFTNNGSLRFGLFDYADAPAHTILRTIQPSPEAWAMD